jgi:hypothetical protein
VTRNSGDEREAMLAARGAPLLTEPVMRKPPVSRVFGFVALALGTIGMRRRSAVTDTISTRDVLLALREPSAKMFSACRGITWLQRDIWQRSIDSVLAELADENADRGKSARER